MKKYAADRKGGFFNQIILAAVLAATFVLCGAVPDSAAEMKGPPLLNLCPRPPEAADHPHLSSQLLLGPIRFFQQYISPTDGARCQFSPTCSAFGYQAISEHGPLLGILMTVDRLMRCSVLTDPAVYRQLSNGSFADPVPHKHSRQ